MINHKQNYIQRFMCTQIQVIKTLFAEMLYVIRVLNSDPGMTIPLNDYHHF